MSYIDDNSYSVARNDPKELTDTLNNQYQRISDYMTSNRLCINDEKTHLVVFCKKSISHLRDEVTLKAGCLDIEPSKSEKLLGLNIDESLK